MVKKLKRGFKNITIAFLVLFLSFAVTQVWAPWKINPFTGKLDYYSLDVGGELSGEAAGDVLYYDGTNWTNLATGTAGQAFIAGATPSWGTLGATYGGTGQDSSGWTGVPVVAAGTWANSAQLIVGYGGTGVDSGAWTGYPYITAGTWAQDSFITQAATDTLDMNGFVGTDIYDNGNSGTAITIDWGNGNTQQVTLTAVGVDITFTEPAKAGRCELWIIQDGTGNRTIDWTHEITPEWPGNVEPTLSTGAADVDLIVFTFIGGTTYRGLFNGDFN